MPSTSPTAAAEDATVAATIIPDQLDSKNSAFGSDDQKAKHENKTIDNNKNEIGNKPDNASNVYSELIQEVVYKGSIMYHVLERIGKLNKKPNDNDKKRTHHFRIEEEDAVYGTNNLEPKPKVCCQTKTRK
jgi:hypothetical protein